MANEGEEKLADSATDAASHVKADVEPAITFRAEEKFAASTTEEVSENKDDLAPQSAAFRAEEKFAASATDEASENKEDVISQSAVFRGEEKFACEVSEDMDDLVPQSGEGEGEGEGEGASVHIVHLIRPEGEEPEVFDIRTLASVIGSEASAKEAVVYHYTHAASGFAARLTPTQVAHLSEKPEVLAVMPDQVCQLIR